MIYHETEHGTLYCGDCMDVLPTLADKSIDLTVTSPPYNIGRIHRTGSFRHSPYDDDKDEEEYQAWQVNVINSIHRLTKDSGSMFYNHKNRIVDKLAITPYTWLLKTRWHIKQELVWFNRSQNFDKDRFYPMTERVYWLVKERDTHIFNVINHHDLFNSSEWQAQGTGGEHKRAFPVDLAANMIVCSNGQVVLDPFAGSGTTAIAAIRLNRKYILIEKEEKYCEIAAKRIETELDQTTIDLEAK